MMEENIFGHAAEWALAAWARRSSSSSGSGLTIERGEQDQSKKEGSEVITSIRWYISKSCFKVRLYRSLDP